MSDASHFDALARTLGIEGSGLGALETIRAGTLVAPRDDAKPAPAPPDERVTLPRLKVAAPDAPTTADVDLELVSLIGRGGMGAVWLARQRALRREVAVKRMNAEVMSPHQAAALVEEARTTGALEHPSILPVHAIGIDADGSPLLVMKRVEGATLDTLCREPDHVAWPDLLRRHEDRVGVIVEVLMRVADALHFAHSRGYVHRDIKPENVMIGAFGETHLLDWGIAVNTRAIDREELERVSIVGTPAFMAPEMARGRVEAVDARTDVYLLGATLHAALTGRPRHEGPTLHAALLGALESKPVEYGPEVPVELAALANRSTHADPSERPPSALAFRDALADYLRHRASLRLADRAAASLAALGTSPSAEKLTSAEGSHALVEARFGFTQALRDWEGNESARAGLRTTLLHLAEAELARRSPESAASIASELELHDPELEARIEALRAEVREAQLLENAARQEAHERNPGVGKGARSILGAAVLLLLITVVGYFGWIRFAGLQVTGVHVLVGDTAMLATVLVLLAVFRRNILSNRWGRNVAFFMLVAFATPFAIGTIAVLRDVSAEAAVPFRMMALAVVTLMAAPSISKWLAAPAAVGAIGALVVTYWPDATLVFWVINAASVAAVFNFEVRGRRRADSARGQ